MESRVGEGGSREIEGGRQREREGKEEKWMD